MGWEELLRNAGFNKEDLERIASSCQYEFFGENISNALKKAVQGSKDYDPNSLAKLREKYGINILLSYLQGFEPRTINLKLIEGERNEKLATHFTEILQKAGYTPEEAQTIYTSATPKALEDTVTGTKMFEPDWLRRINLQFGIKIAMMYFKYYNPDGTIGPYAHLNTMFTISELERLGTIGHLSRTNS